MKLFEHKKSRISKVELHRRVFFYFASTDDGKARGDVIFYQKLLERTVFYREMQKSSYNSAFFSFPNQIPRGIRW